MLWMNIVKGDIDITIIADCLQEPPPTHATTNGEDHCANQRAGPNKRRRPVATTRPSVMKRSPALTSPPRRACTLVARGRISPAEDNVAYAKGR